MTDHTPNLRNEAVDFLYKHGDLTFSAAYAAVDKLCGNGFYITRTPTPAPNAGAVKVKPLVWVPTKALRKHLVEGETVIEMTTKGAFLYTLVKNYQIGMSWSAYRGRNSPIKNGTCVSLDQAKAAAQDDIAARIQSALIGAKP